MRCGSSLPLRVRAAYAVALSVLFLREAFDIAPLHHGGANAVAPAFAFVVLVLIWVVVAALPALSKPSIPTATAWILYHGEGVIEFDTSIMRYVPRGTYISPFARRGRPRWPV